MTIPRPSTNYAAAFDSSFRGASGALADVEPVAVQYGIAFRQNEPDADGNYFVDHTTTLIGIDREGSVRIGWGPDATPDDLDALLDL